MIGKRGGFRVGKRFSTLALAALFVAQAAPAQAAVASAVPSPMCQATGGTTGDSHADAEARRVQKIVVSPALNTAFFAGKFTGLIPPAGGPAVSRNRLGACSLSTGEILPWNPNADGPVFALATDGTTIYAGGSFKIVGGEAHVGVVAIDARTGLPRTVVDPATGTSKLWNPKVGSGTVRSLAVSGTTLYLGGTFTKINGTPRTALAAVDTVTGQLKDWDPGKRYDPAAAYDIRGLVVSGTKVIAGEWYTNNRMNNLIAVDATTGAALPWSSAPNREVLDMSLSGSRVYVASAGLGGFVNSYDVSTGIQRLEIAVDGNVQGIYSSSDTVYAGGHFDNVQSGSGWFSRRLTPRDRLLAVRISDGALLPWNPGVDSSGAGPYAIQGGGNSLLVGGEFAFVASKAHAGIAAFPVPAS